MEEKLKWLPFPNVLQCTSSTPARSQSLEGGMQDDASTLLVQSKDMEEPYTIHYSYTRRLVLIYKQFWLATFKEGLVNVFRKIVLNLVRIKLESFYPTNAEAIEGKFP